MRSEDRVYGFFWENESSYYPLHVGSKKEQSNFLAFDLQLNAKVKVRANDDFIEAVNFPVIRFIELKDWREHSVNSEEKVGETWLTRLDD